jgi:elongator complex protein 4
MSSFKRRGEEEAGEKSVSAHQKTERLPRGVKLSLTHGQILISSGIESLDNILGGGLPLGSLVLIEEDVFTNDSKLLSNYFIAQGLASGQRVAFLSPEECLDIIFEQLPSWSLDPTSYMKKTQKNEKIVDEKDHQYHSGSDRMKIAWRYERLRDISDSSSLMSKINNVYLHEFDFSRHISESDAPKEQIYSWKSSEVSYQSVLYELSRLLQVEHSASPSTSSVGVPCQQVLRICLKSWASPLCGDLEPFFRFLHSIRGLLRHSLATCMITVPAHLYEATNSGFYSLIEHAADLLIRITSFAGLVMNETFTDYHGMMQIRKLPCLNTLSHFPLDTNQFLFRLKKKQFLFQKLSLPPESSAPKGQTHLHSSSEVTCSSGNRSNPLDF